MVSIKAQSSIYKNIYREMQVKGIWNELHSAAKDFF